MTTLTKDIHVAYWLKKLRMHWRDGSTAFCKPCDQEVPMEITEGASGFMLECPAGHLVHPVTVIVSKGWE